MFIKNNPSAQQRARGAGITYNTYDANDPPNAAVMIVPDQLGLSPNATNLKYRKQKKYVRFNGVRSRVNQFIGGAAGINPNLNENSRFASLLDLDEKLDENLANAANATLFDFQNLVKGGFKTNPVSYSAKEIKDVFLKEGGAGALSAFKGAIFEGLINAITGGVETDQDSSLDIAFGNGQERQVLEEIFGLTPGKFEFGDFKASLSDGNKEKYRNQILKNLPKALEKRALTKAEIAGQASKGYIPNYAMSALDEAIEREKAAGIPVNQIRLNQSGKLRNSKNPEGLAVTNTRDEPTGRIPENAARGFVPNFVGREMAASAARFAKGSETDEKIKDSGADASAKLFALSTAAFALQGAFGGIADETEGVGKTLAEFSQGVTQATTTLLLLQGLGVKLGPGKGFIPKSLSGSGDKLSKLFTNLVKSGSGFSKVFGFLGKGLLRLIPGIGQLVIGFQILSPLLKKWSVFNDAVSFTTEKLRQLGELIGFVDSQEEKRQKENQKRNQADFQKLLSETSAAPSTSLAKEQLERSRLAAQGVAVSGNTDIAEAALKKAGQDIAKSLQEAAKEQAGDNSSLVQELVNTQKFFLETLSPSDRAELAKSPGKAASFAAQQRALLTPEDQRALEKAERNAAKLREDLTDPKLEKVRASINRSIEKQDKLILDIINKIIEKNNLDDENLKNQERTEGVLKRIVAARANATNEALKAIVNRETELEFELKLQNSLKNTSDIQKQRNEQQLRSLQQQKKSAVEVLGVFNKIIDQSFDLQQLPGGTKVSAADVREFEKTFQPFRESLAAGTAIDRGALVGAIGSANLTRLGDEEAIADEILESVELKRKELKLIAAEENIRKANLTLIKLSTLEEGRRLRLLDDQIKRKERELQIEKDISKSRSDLEISRLRAEAPAIQSERGQADLDKNILELQKAQKQTEARINASLARENAVSRSIDLLRKEGVKIEKDEVDKLRAAAVGQKVDGKFVEGSPEKLTAEVQRILDANKEEQRNQKLLALKAKQEARKEQLSNIQFLRDINTKNLSAADKQIEAAEKQLRAAQIQNNDAIALESTRQKGILQKDFDKEIAKLNAIGAQKGVQSPEFNNQLRIVQDLEGRIADTDSAIRKAQETNKELLEKQKPQVKPTEQNSEIIELLKRDIEKGAKEIASLEKPGASTTGVDSSIINIQDDLAKKLEESNNNRLIAENEYTEGVKRIGAGLTNFSNLIAKQIAASGATKRQALFQVATSADPSQILSGLTTARRESALQATGDPEAANQAQALLEKRLDLIKATSTAQRIEAEKEYEINLQIYRIRKEINETSSDEEIEAAALRIQELLSAPDTLREGLVKALAIDGKEASLNIKNTLIEGAVGFRDALIDGLMQAIQEGASLKDILLSAATDFLNKITRANLENAFGAIAGALGTATKGIGGAFTKGFASGGMIRGGSGMKDDVPALLMGGEYVMKKSSVQKYGQGFMEKVNNGDLPKFANGGLVDLFGFPLSPNERNRLESSSAYGNPLERGQLPIQTGEGGFFGPGIFGGGAIKGRQDLLAFAGQSFTAGLSDRKVASRSEFGGVAGISLEPESVRLTRFGRTLGTPLQRATQEAKGQAFEAATIEAQERTRLKLEEKQRKKERKEAFKRAIIGAVVSTAFGAIAQSASAGFSNAFSGAQQAEAGIFSSLGSGLKGIFTGAPVAGSQQNFGGLFNLFNGRGTLTGTNLIETIKTNPIDPIAQAFIKNNPDSPLAQAFSNRTPIKAVDFSGSPSDLGAGFRRAGVSSTTDLENILTRRATGGYIPSRAGVDTVPTMLSGGEFVLNSAATQRIGPANLERANAGLEELQRENSEDLIDKIEELIDIQKESTGGGDITITVNSTSSGQTQGETEDSAGASTKDQELARKIKEQVLLIINEEKRLGGTLRRI